LADSLERLQEVLADRYRIEGTLGAGGMATVYLAYDVRHDRKVALKVLRPELSSAVGPDRFQQEIRTIARLTHPHILPLHDSGEAGGLLFYVMPYVQGETLRDRLNREAQLPLDEALEITSEVADALSYAHSQGVVHRDIKPENILLEEGHAVVADFGVARAISAVGADRLTDTGLAVGTPAYMSPEQASGSELIDGRSDVFSLACVLYEMLAGEPPHTGITPQAILARQLSGEIPSLQPVRTSVGPELDDAVKRALAPAPADRYATATEFVEVLRGRGVPRRRRRSSIVVAISRRQLRKGLMVVAGVAAVIALVVVVRVVLSVRDARAGERPVTLAVYPFRATGPEAGSLGEGVADLLAAAVDGTLGMAVSDPAGLWRPLKESGADLYRVPGLDEGVQLTRDVGAPAMVLGALTAVGGRFDINARVYDADGTLRTTLRAAAPAESLPHAVNRLAIGVVAELWERDTLPTVPVIESFATQSIDALQAYLEGKGLKRQGLYEDAQEALERAIQLDSTFALAYMELFDVRSWVLFLNAQPFVGLRQIIDQAMKYRDRLTARNRMRVEAMLALDETDGVRAASLLERILEIDSVDVDALHMVAFTYRRDGWQMMRGLGEITRTYDEVLAVDPTSAVAHAVRAELAMLEGDPATVGEELEVLGEAATGSAFVRGRLGAYAVVRAEPSARPAMLRELAAAPAPEVFTSLRDLRIMRPQLAEQLLGELLADTMPVFHRRVGTGGRTQLWFAQGRVAANDSLVRAGELDVIRPAVNRFMVATQLAGVGDSAATARAVEELSAYAPLASLTSDDLKPDAWVVAWTLAAYHAAAGDTVTAMQWQRGIESMAAGDTPWDWRRSLSADIDARLAARRGDLEGAELEARRAYDLWQIHSASALETDPDPAMRFHLAEILRANGRLEQAEWLYRSLCPPYTWYGFHTARASLELADMLRSRGEREEAIRFYQMAERLWERGEPEVVGSWLARVRDGLRALGAG
jgi:tRNA A-37 threonylcarbamoyl transferase component Bud32/tetratricopeptide (TPR) repeat protein